MYACGCSKKSRWYAHQRGCFCAQRCAHLCALVTNLGDVRTTAATKIKDLQQKARLLTSPKTRNLASNLAHPAFMNTALIKKGEVTPIILLTLTRARTCAHARVRTYARAFKGCSGNNGTNLAKFYNSFLNNILNCEVTGEVSKFVTGVTSLTSQILKWYAMKCNHTQSYALFSLHQLCHFVHKCAQSRAHVTTMLPAANRYSRARDSPEVDGNSHVVCFSLLQMK
jgi:hypothetical protein